MHKQFHVAILYGGESVEHKVSCRSASTVCEQLVKSGYTPIPIAISRHGRWSLHTHEITSSPIALTGDFIPAEEVVIRAGLGIFKLANGEKIQVDIAFPLAHGYGGEDGKVQGLLDMAHIPCIGCSVEASANGMRKFTTKILAGEISVPTLPAMVVERRKLHTLQGDQDPYMVQLVQEIHDRIGTKIVVKPEDGGSSIGVTVVSPVNEKTVWEALNEVAVLSQYIMIEPYLEHMQELEVAVVTEGNSISVSDPGMLIDPLKEQHKLVTYEQKYLSDHCAFMQIPADVPTGIAQAVSSYALELARIIGVEGYARIDFFYLPEEKAIYFNEINTIPGMTATSHFPKLAQSMGYDWPRLLSVLIEEGFDTYTRRTDRKTVAVE